MIEIARRPDGLFILTAEQWLPRRRDEVFPFFAEAANLEKITPSFLHFRILSPLPIEMRQGARIDYRISLRGIPMRWRTEITVWEPPFRFVDTQLTGPYRQWIHEHTFEDRDGGTWCRDRVEYRVPGGALVHTLFVERDVRAIFAYRRDALARLFGSSQIQASSPAPMPP
jgi:ligand-binding SRPBCC domain-containing protein